MIRKLLSVLPLLLAAPASPHSLDEYVQATLISLETGHVRGTMNLVPGVAVYSKVRAQIDADSDGVLAEAEKHRYGQLVLRDLTLSIDGKPVKLTLTAVAFPSEEQMKEGMAGIRIEFQANLPGDGPLHGGGEHKLVFVNHHLPEISAYLVNCLVPQQPDLRIVAQHRTPNQSVYELDFIATRVPRPS